MRRWICPTSSRFLCLWSPRSGSEGSSRRRQHFLRCNKKAFFKRCSFVKACLRQGGDLKPPGQNITALCPSRLIMQKPAPFSALQLVSLLVFEKPNKHSPLQRALITRGSFTSLCLRVSSDCVFRSNTVLRGLMQISPLCVRALWCRPSWSSEPRTRPCTRSSSNTETIWDKTSSSCRSSRSWTKWDRFTFLGTSEQAVNRQWDSD